MKSIYLKIVLLGSLVLANTTSAIPQGTKHYRACTFHGEIYAVIPLGEVCSSAPVLDYILINSSETHYTNPVHAKLEPHNPECFDSHMIVQ